LSYRSWALWMLGYPEAALADTSRALEEARKIGQAASLMYALVHASIVHIQCGDYSTAGAEADELVSLAEEKGASFWNALGMSVQGCLLVLTGKPGDAFRMITASMAALRSTGSTLWMPMRLAYLARAYAELGQFGDAWRYIDEALRVVETAREKWHEADIYRMAGEIALLSPQRAPAKAETYFEQALAVARAQRAKSWELRAAMSLARLWRDEGKRRQARDCLAPIYDWFTEGFDTLDLRQAKALLDALAEGTSEGAAGVGS
jgi:predicted ATPase